MQILIDTNDEIIKILTKESHNDIVNIVDIVNNAVYNFPIIATDVTDLPENILEEFDESVENPEAGLVCGVENTEEDIIPKSTSYDNKD